MTNTPKSQPPTADLLNALAAVTCTVERDVSTGAYEQPSEALFALAVEAVRAYATAVLDGELGGTFAGEVALTLQAIGENLVDAAVTVGFGR